MQVIVKLNPAATRRERAARGGRSTIGVLKKSGWTLVPVHPTTRDGSVDSFFLVEIDDPVEAARVAEALLKEPEVEAAYLKPADEPA
jgi:hypothetical protein